ncbi:protein S100-B-like [Periophthalmus magnuspinnatus]|uniref:protein S100-B-like n=1 Tax=Periophthalmus magnuspinnatus TaxID=409849 RepID=UPI00145AF66F|nr:protein S100-B-like [Periophthalmus magnuspinnatus]
MASLPAAMAMIRAVFDQYSKNKKTLSKHQVAELLRAQFGMEPGKNEEAEKMFCTLDNDGSGDVDFKEFVTFVAAVCVCVCE